MVDAELPDAANICQCPRSPDIFSLSHGRALQRLYTERRIQGPRRHRRGCLWRCLVRLVPSAVCIKIKTPIRLAAQQCTCGPSAMSLSRKLLRLIIPCFVCALFARSSSSVTLAMKTSSQSLTFSSRQASKISRRCSLYKNSWRQIFIALSGRKT